MDYFINLPTSKLYVKNEEITEQVLVDQFDELKDAISFYREYPDIFVDEILKEPDSDFKFYPIQRIMLRVFARHQYVFGSFNRGFSKSFMAILFEVIECILFPGNKSFLTTGTDEQGAKIASDKLNELFELFPRLRDEVIHTSRGKYFEEGRDHIKVKFKNNSVFEVVGARVTNLGRRFQQGFIEEAATTDGDKLARVIIPMMNVDRLVKGISASESDEITKRQIFLTSAGFKNTYAYDKLIQILIWQAVKNDGTAFVFGGSHELATKMGLLDKDFVDLLKEDGTYNDMLFDREYGSIWSGISEGSFFDADQFDRLRKLGTPTFSSEVENNINVGAYYIVSMDVGRLNDRSVVCVFRVYPNPAGTSEKSLVYIDQFEEMHFELQAYYVKELIEKYNAKMLVIDANGIGQGLVDYLVRPTKDLDGKDAYPPYSVVNDERYDKYKQDDSEPKIFNIKATKELNNAIAVNTLTQMSSSKVKFLIDEKLAKLNLDRKVQEGKKKTTVADRAKLLKPHVLTSGLKEEMLNLRQKVDTASIGTLVTLEQSNRKLHKDKYSAFSYGLYWIKLQDDSRKKYKQANRFKSAMLYNTNNRWK